MLDFGIQHKQAEKFPEKLRLIEDFLFQAKVFTVN